jgi:hypothetical protein
MNRRELMSGALASLLAVKSLHGQAFANTEQDGNTRKLTPASTASDRWLEMDLYWFRQDDIAGSVREFWSRFFPLYIGVDGYRGLILNVGWTPEYILDWSGSLDQRIVLPEVNGQASWVSETAPLTGSWEQRIEEWDMRFAQPIQIPRHAYGPWKYGDLKQLATELRTVAAQRGISDFKVGSLTLAWRAAYGTLESVYGSTPTFLSRHLEIFGAAKGEKEWLFMAFNPSNRLHRDDRRYGGLPDGIPEGMPVYRAFAEQWGSLSRAVGLDALMLRDSFGFPVPYQRSGPYGDLAPSAQIARDWTAYGVAALVRESKLANPAALLMMYSNGASAIGDWRSNCCDLEAVAREGYLDIFVDQTWVGEWNEVGVRVDDFWNSPVLGYTYQLAYLLMHAAILADTGVRHYPLIEGLDAWESEDSLDTVPGRVRWKIWAYTHAGVKTPAGLKLPAGSYISWGQRGDHLLSANEVDFLTSNLNEASADARRTTDIFGPTLVYSRETMQWQMDHASENNDIKEWIDEQAGSVMKWPLPILSVTRLEWLPRVHSDLFILQTPAHLTASHLDLLVNLIDSGQPVAIFGSPAGGIDSRLAELIGLTGVKNPATFQSTLHLAASGQDAGQWANHVPAQFPTLTRLSTNRSLPDARVIYSVEKNPALVLNVAGGKHVLAWDPPSLVTVVQHLPLVETWGGSAAPYALTAGALNSLLATSKALHVKRVDMNQTMSLCAWRTADGGTRLLVANLEEGLRDDSDASCHAILVLPDNWKAAQVKDTWSDKALKVNDNTVAINLGQAQSLLFRFQRPKGDTSVSTTTAELANSDCVVCRDKMPKGGLHIFKVEPD